MINFLELLGSIFILILLISIITHFCIDVWNKRFNFFINKDNYLINKHLLDDVSEIYKNSVHLPEVEKLRRNHNLDENSQLNAIKAFKTAEEKLLKKSSLEIYKMLTQKNIDCLKQFYSEDAIILIIINNLRS